MEIVRKAATLGTPFPTTFRGEAADGAETPIRGVEEERALHLNASANIVNC